MVIYIIRHGQTTSDVEDRYGGDYEDHLTEQGKEQAKRLAEKIKNFGIEVIFSSPKVRAQETAKILQDSLGLEIRTVKDLRERNLYGVLTGMRKSEAKEKFPDLVERLKNTQDTIETAESWKDFVDRIVKSFKETAKSKYKVVGIVTHGGPIRRIFGEVLGIKREAGEMSIADCAWVEVETNGKEFKLIKSEGINYK